MLTERKERRTRKNKKDFMYSILHFDFATRTLSCMVARSLNLRLISTIYNKVQGQESDYKISFALSKKRSCCASEHDRIKGCVKKYK